MNLNVVSQSAVATIGLLFLLAGLSKVVLLQQRSATWHPLFVSSARRRRYATLLISVGLLADATVIGLLLVHSVAGSLAGAVVIGLYTVFAVTGSSALSSSCHCFAWGLLDVADSRSLVMRNAVLTLVASFGMMSPLPLSRITAPAGIGALVLVIGLVAVTKTVVGWQDKELT